MSPLHLALQNTDIIDDAGGNVTLSLQLCSH